MAGLVEKAELRAAEMVASEKERDDSLSLDKEKREDDSVKRMALRSGLNEEDADWLAEVPAEEQRRIFHKVDDRLDPMLALLYLIAHLDRASEYSAIRTKQKLDADFEDIGNAKIEGLEDSLGMTDTDYNVSNLEIIAVNKSLTVP